MSSGGDDLCDLCMSSGVNVERTTYCGKTIGIECGCNEDVSGTCNDPACEQCRRTATTWSRRTLRSYTSADAAVDCTLLSSLETVAKILNDSDNVLTRMQRNQLVTAKRAAR